MDRALFAGDEALGGDRLRPAHRRRGGRRRDDRRHVCAASCVDLSCLGPRRPLGGFAPSTGSGLFPAKRPDAPVRTLGEDARHLRPGRPRRLSCPSASASPPVTAIVAPDNPGDVSPAAEGARAVDLARRGPHR